jgi:rhodanese-related sulfurtransferase
MPHDIHDRRELQTLMDQGVQLVDVLAAEEFEEDHLPGAINIRLRDIDSDAVRQLDPSRPVVVYCWDSA